MGSIAVVLIVGSIVATLALRSAPETAATPTPSDTSTSDASVSGIVAGANGCLAGPGITADQLREIRAKKDFTPIGAVEFLGALDQFYSAADPNYRSGVEQITAEMTSGDAQSQLASINSSIKPDDGNTHASYLGEGYYKVVEVTSNEVTVDTVSQQFRNGAPIPGDTHGTVYGGGRYTVTPTNDGWVVTALGTPGESIDQMIQSGQRFEGGC